jgi:pre-mRNA-processing factor 19
LLSFCHSCVVSGEAPEQPVVSTKSGNLFERRLIEKYITDNGKDPINGEAMTVEDLIEVKSSKF